MEKYLVEIEKRVLSLSKQKELNSEKNLIRIGIRVPLIRSLLKKNYLFKGLSQEEILEIWDFIWHKTKYFEVMSLALYYYQKNTLNYYEFKTIKNWTKKCNCWEHSDDLSKIYANFFESNHDLAISTYKVWNKSNSLWERRQSIVALLEYSSKRNKVLTFDKLISFVDQLLNDPEYYVQKGIGWTIREIYNIYPKETLNYIEKKLDQINPMAYSAATEKIPKNKKEELNLSRRKNRIKK